MIGPREYVLWVGPLGRIELADRKLMWVRSAKVAVVPLVFILAVAFFPKFAAAGGLFLFLVLSAVGNYFMVSRALFAAPWGVTETQKLDGQSALTIATRYGELTARAHPAMAEFLLGAIKPGRRKLFPLLRKIPSALLHPEMKQQMWPYSAFSAVVIAAALWLVVAAVSTR